MLVFDSRALEEAVSHKYLGDVCHGIEDTVQQDEFAYVNNFVAPKAQWAAPSFNNAIRNAQNPRYTYY